MLASADRGYLHYNDKVQMTPLPARSFAPGVALLAMVGSALSLLIHSLTLLGFYSKAILNFETYLFIGLFPTLIMAGLAYNRLLSEFPLSYRTRMYNPRFSLKVMRKLTSNAPRWLRALSLSLLLYAPIRSLLSGGFFQERAVSDALGLSVFSAYVAGFLSLAATILISYAGFERPLRADELS